MKENRLIKLCTIIFMLIVYINLSGAINYLIVANAGLSEEPSLADLINWKTAKGYNVVTHFVNSGSEVVEIDEWIELQYAQFAPEQVYLLIIGDADGQYAVPNQDIVLPPLPEPIHSDLIYGVVGDISVENRIPQIMVGRFSVRDTEDLINQVQKTIWYENEQFDMQADLSYLINMLGESNNRENYADWRNAVIAYGWDNYFNDYSFNPFTNEVTAFNGISYTYPHEDTLALLNNIKTDLSNGVAFYYYFGNSDEYKLKDPQFGIADIADIENQDKYPILFMGG
jgi:peptidase C25-like protein